MESLEEVKKLVSDAKNICIIPSEINEPESLPAALALFYTLKELHKNVNLIIDDFPEKFNFLVPSLDFISSPKNFVISIPKSVADVSQVYYQKNEESLKIHLTIDKGNIKKENVSFYFSEAKPDLVITLGIQNFQTQLQKKLDSFGFLLDAPLINIDNANKNTKFGKVNSIENKSLAEILLDLLPSLDQVSIKKEVANCLLTGLIAYYNNFKNPNTGHQVFEIAADLIKRGAERQRIIENLYKVSKDQVNFLSDIFQNLRMAENNEISFAILDSYKFQNFNEGQIDTAVEKISAIGVHNDLLVLWKSHASDPMIKGFFYSKNQSLITRIAQNQQRPIKNDWVLIGMPDMDIMVAKNKMLDLLLNKVHYDIS